MTLGRMMLECPDCGTKRVWSQRVDTWVCPACTGPHEYWQERRQRIADARKRYNAETRRLRLLRKRR